MNFRVLIVNILFVVLFSNLCFSQELDTIQVSVVDIYSDRYSPLFMQSYAVDSVTMIRYQRSNLGEMLGMMSDLMLRSYGPGGIALISFRGASPSHTRVIWNGQNLNSPLTGQVDFSLLPVEFADQIIIKPGSASMQDQAGGLGGSIVINNRANWVDSTRLTFSAEFGSYGLSHKNIDYQKRFGQLQWRGRYARREARNNFEFRNTAVLPHQTDTMFNAHLHSQFLSNEFYYRADKRNLISFIQVVSYTDRELPPQMTRFDSPRFLKDFYHEELHDWLINQLVRWDHYFAHSQLMVQSGVLFRSNSYFLQTRNADMDLISSIASENISTSFFQQVAFKGEKGASKYGLTGELNYHQASIHDLVNEVLVKPTRLEFNWFGEYYYSLSQQLKLFTMFRSEKRGEYLLPFMPSLGFSFYPIKGYDGNLKLSTAYNARVPDLNDLFYEPGGNPDLLPEESYQSEIAIEMPVVKDRFVLKASAYYSDIFNWILWLNSDYGYWTPINLEKVNAQGIETSMHFDYKRGNFRGRFSARYNYTSTVYEGNENQGALIQGEQLIYIPLHSIQSITALNYNLWFVDLVYAYTGDRSTAQTGQSSQVYYAIPMRAFSLIDMHFGKKWILKHQSITCGFKINNLLSSNYQMLPFRPMPGRNFGIYLQWQLGS